MPNKAEIARISEICAHFRKYADTIERLVAVRDKGVSEMIKDVVEAVGEAKRQLNDLGSVADISGMSVDLATTVLNLRNRYEMLEGMLKELRNDVSRGQRLSSERIKPMQTGRGKGEQ